MQVTRTALALSLGLILFQTHAQAAPPLTLNNGSSTLIAQNSNAWVEINKAALDHNIQTLLAQLAGKSKLCAVLKADAYGHGIGLVMPSVIKYGVPCVAVASNEEMRVVRQSGYKGELIRVRTASLSELEDALQYNAQDHTISRFFLANISQSASK